MPPRASKTEIEGLILLLDVGVSMSTKVGNTSTTYLQSCVDIIQMIAQRKMFETSKDELSLILFGTRETANELWNGSSDDYSHVTVARPLEIVDWKLLDYLTNNINATNLQGDSLDGLIVASNHFHEDSNTNKFFKDKRIMILTDFSSSTDDDDKLNTITKGLAKHEIRVDVISPFKDNDEEESDPRKGNDNATASNSVNGDGENETKTMTKEQEANHKLLKQICEETEGAMYSFDEVLNVLTSYKPKSLKSSGTKYQMTIGDSFSLPIVSLIKTKENKPDIFKQKKLYAKDDSETKTDRARFTKDDEQRDLDDKEDVVDAFKYGTTFVPIDDTDSLRLNVTKCFSIIGFTKTENIKRHYFIGDATNQIMPDSSAGEEVEEAFVNIVKSMLLQDVYGIVRRVFSVRSSPELGCLIPYIKNNITCLYYIQIPFDDDIKGFTLENFNLNKKFKPTDSQLDLMDTLIDSMDLTKSNGTALKNELDETEEEIEETELYDPHTTINPYIQRMFQSIAERATNPKKELPNFETHITATLLAKQGEQVRNQTTQKLLKRCADEFPLKEMESKKSKTADESMFDSKTKKDTDTDEKNAADQDMDAAAASKDFNLDDLLNSKSNSKVKKIGTITPANDFKLLAERILANLALKQDEASNQCDFEQLCLQLQVLIKEFFNESLRQFNCEDEDENNMTVFSFQEKAFDCIRIQREYCLKFKVADTFNMFLKTFKIFLLNESNNKKYASQVEKFWTKFFLNSSVSFITHNECSYSDMTDEESGDFLKNFKASKEEVNVNNSNLKEDEEDLLDLM
jgi:ATP-dependent DNA helicase 2 subunit 2